MNVQISAIICTLNRANYLPKAIQSLVEQSLDNSHYEILVVDNHSTDNTKQIVTEEFASIGNLRYLYEPIPGLSRARNTGWQNARGEYVAYLDDDAIASPQWLEKILEAFETVKPQPGCVGGKVEPIWEVPKPTWLNDKMLPWLTVIDLYDRPLFLEDNQFLVGANMSYSKGSLEAISGFINDLTIYNDEIWAQKQIRKMGYNCFYDPQIMVGHHVSQSRLNQKYFIKRMYKQGIADAILHVHEKPSSRRNYLKLARQNFKIFLNEKRELLTLIDPSKDPEDIVRKCLKYHQIGYIVGLVGQALVRKK